MHGSPGLHPALCVRCIALPCGLGGPRVVGIGAIHNIRSAMLVAPRVRLDLKGALEERPRHPLARRHPETGRPCLYLSPENTARVEGLEPPSAGRALVQQLVHGLLGDEDPERYVYRHVWCPGDAVLWDNRQTIHRATPFDGGAAAADGEAKERLMWRVTVRGGVPGRPSDSISESSLEESGAGVAKL